MLELRGVTKSFGNLCAVDSLSLTVPHGQIVGLIGPNGSGKSTLLSLIAGNQRPDRGEILLNGADLAKLSADQIFHRGLVRSYQDPALFFRMTVLDNALLPIPGQWGERPWWAPFHRIWRAQEQHNAQSASRVLEQVQLRSHFATPSADLSGGQMKLMELGRSLLGNPQMLLLDEPTAGVAPTLAYAIFEQIAALRRSHGLTFFIVEHRLELLFDFVDSLYVMHLGRLIAQGPPREIAANQAVREIYFGE